MWRDVINIWEVLRCHITNASTNPLDKWKILSSEQHIINKTWSSRLDLQENARIWNCCFVREHCPLGETEGSCSTKWIFMSWRLFRSAYTREAVANCHHATSWILAFPNLFRAWIHCFNNVTLLLLICMPQALGSLCALLFPWCQFDGSVAGSRSRSSEPWWSHACYKCIYVMSKVALVWIKNVFSVL